MPRPTHAGSSRRLSLVFFHEPNPDALVAPLPTCVAADRPARYAPVIAGAYRRGKVAALRGAAAGL
jgi:isopenicillin N synthase-like dioxygenase